MVEKKNVMEEDGFIQNDSPGAIGRSTAIRVAIVDVSRIAS